MAAPNNSKLFQLLQTFTDAEQKQFVRFLKSPFFNRRPETLRLYVFLKNNEHKVPDKTLLFQAVFGKSKPYDDHRLRMAFSFLYQSACTYLRVDDFLNDPVENDLRLAAQSRKRGLNKIFDQIIKQVSVTLEKSTYRNAAFLEETYRLKLEKYRRLQTVQPAGELGLQELSDQLDQQFLARKLWQSCFMLSHQAVSNRHYSFGLLDAALSSIRPETLADQPAVALYYYCYRALTNPNEPAHFQAFKAQLLRSGSVFPPDELRDLYILAVNFCIRQYNAGNQAYLRDQFDFYKNGLAEDFFLVEGYLSRYTYQNIVTSAIVTRELAWADAFLEQYSNHLRPEEREGVFSFNSARLNYEHRRFSEALLLLQRAESRDILLLPAVKMLQMKIYYELGEFDLLESHIQALQAFIRRKKSLSYHKENYLKTLHFTRKLLETNLYDKQKRAALRLEIEQAGALAEREWLLEQLN